MACEVVDSLAQVSGHWSDGEANYNFEAMDDDMMFAEVDFDEAREVERAAKCAKKFGWMPWRIT